jgi:FixJ family two-component response regulator
MDALKPVIYIVDDEEAIRLSIAWLLRLEGFRTQVFDSAEAFLEVCRDDHGGCVIMDIRLSGMSGLHAQTWLIAQGVDLPVIFLTGHGDVQMSRQAFRSGAIDFIQKPCEADALLDSVREALEKNQASRNLLSKKENAQELYDRLSRREKEIMKLVVEGKSSKEIGIELFISHRTVEVHRSHIMEKMHAPSISKLITQSHTIGLIPEDS